MIKLIVLIFIFITSLLIIVPARVDALGLNEVCIVGSQNIGQCDYPLDCVFNSTGQEGDVYWCQSSTPTGPIADVFGKINLPEAIRNLGKGGAAISQVLSNIVTLIFVAAGVVFLFMIIISAFQWIVSGGDKEAVGKARGRLTAAIIGIVILSLTFVIANFIGEITGFKF